MAKVPKKVTAQYLERAALFYLDRYASSSGNLRRVLMNKVRRSAHHHDTDPEQGAAWVDELIGRLQERGYVDDQSYAEMRAASLFRRGGSTRLIKAKLYEKGISQDVSDKALNVLSDEMGEDADLRAAAILVRRRRLGPFRKPEENRALLRDKDLAVLARAGFAREVAVSVIDRLSVDEIEALALPFRPPSL